MDSHELKAAPLKFGISGDVIFYIYHQPGCFSFCLSVILVEMLREQDLTSRQEGMMRRISGSRRLWVTYCFEI